MDPRRTLVDGGFAVYTMWPLLNNSVKQDETRLRGSRGGRELRPPGINETRIAVWKPESPCQA